MYEIVYVQFGGLGDYVCEQCVVGDVEWYVQENVVVVLVELVVEFVVDYVELEQVVVWY